MRVLSSERGGQVNFYLPACSIVVGFVFAAMRQAAMQAWLLASAARVRFPAPESDFKSYPAACCGITDYSFVTLTA